MKYYDNGEQWKGLCKKEVQEIIRIMQFFYFISICTIFQFRVFLIKKIMSVFRSCVCYIYRILRMTPWTVPLSVLCRRVSWLYGD